MQEQTALLFNTLTSDAYTYFGTAQKFNQNNDLEGALVNFLLALNNLKYVKKFIDTTIFLPLEEAKEKEEEEEKESEEEEKEGSEHSESEEKNAIREIVTDVDQAIVTIMSYVEPLQEKIQRLKNNRVCMTFTVTGLTPAQISLNPSITATELPSSA